MSSNFYSSIAKYYQHIFPFNPAQVNFLKNVLPYNGAKVLDVGCAIGDLAFALTHFGFPTWAFDFDGQMIEIAQGSKQEDSMFPVFEQLDMRLIDQRYPEAYFNTIICFGNTLVHLLRDEDILPDQWVSIYSTTDQRIEELLQSGQPVLDASRNFQKTERVSAKSIADRAGVPFLVVYIDIPVEIARQRWLENRRTFTRRDVSDKDFEDTIRAMQAPLADEAPLIFHDFDEIDPWLVENASKISCFLHF